MKRFRAVHGDLYSYSNMEFIKTDGKLAITCKKHGDFKQSFREHIKGGGCQRCSGRHRWTTSEFKENALRVHGVKYDYSKSVYTGALNELVITCGIHGDFTTQPSRHVLRGDGCPGCNRVRETTVEDFLERSAARFGNRYDYSLVEYVDTKTPVKIICSSHGVFEQPPSYHLANAVGCQQCSYNVSNKETAWLDSLDLPPTARRQAKLKLGTRMRNVDAFDPSTNTVYEFWGDWWHGHPDFFDPEAIHQLTKKTYGELYAATMRKRALIQKAGYTLVEIWEHEYDAMALAGTAPRPSGRLSVKKSLDARGLKASSHKKLTAHAS